MKQLELTLDGQTTEYQLPESWDDITVGQFATIYSIINSDINALEKTIGLVSAVTGVDSKILFKTPVSQLNELHRIIGFINTTIDSEPAEKVKVADEEYILYTNFKELTYGETISIELITQKYPDIYEGIAELLCVFLRKQTESGELEEFDSEFMSREELFKSIPITAVYNLFTNFFVGAEQS